MVCGYLFDITKTTLVVKCIKTKTNENNLFLEVGALVGLHQALQVMQADFGFDKWRSKKGSRNVGPDSRPEAGMAEEDLRDRDCSKLFSKISSLSLNISSVRATLKDWEEPQLRVSM